MHLGHAAVRPDVPLGEVGTEGQDERGREQHAGPAEEREPTSEATAIFPRRLRDDPPQRPCHHEAVVEECRLGEAGGDRQCKRGRQEQSPPVAESSLARNLYAEDGCWEKRQWIDRCVLEPGKRAVEGEHDAAGARDGVARPEAAEKEVSAKAGRHLEDEPEGELPARPHEQQCQREEDGCLHPRREGRTQALVRVPPRHVPVQPVERCAMAESLRRRSDVDVERGHAREQRGAPCLRQPGVGDQRVHVGDADERWEVGNKDGNGDEEGPEVAGSG